MRIQGLLIGLVTLLLFTSCKKEKFATVSFEVEYKVDAETVVMNDIRYQNAAGYNYSVTKILYYISNITLTGDGNENFSSDQVFYMDASNPDLSVFKLEDVPYGKYTGITFNIGVEEALNVTNGLPNTVENNAMAWPEMMGGGYHHIKFEGLYVNGSDTSGFAMHLGLNGNQPNCYNNDDIVVDAEDVSLKLTMNMNEFFRTPEVYDFVTDGVSIMNNNASMQKLARNADDCFDN